MPENMSENTPTTTNVIEHTRDGTRPRPHKKIAPVSLRRFLHFYFSSEISFALASFSAIVVFLGGVFFVEVSFVAVPP